MKLLKDIERIYKKKYCLFELPNSNYNNIYKYIEDFPEEKQKYINKKNNQYFKEKYLNNITSGYYGFEMNSYMPECWRDIIDEVLELCIKNDPNFGIHQIKIKLGSVRFYVASNVIEDLYKITRFLDENLYSKYLMY